MEKVWESLTNEELLEFVRDMQVQPEKIKLEFDFYEHLEELTSRGKIGKMITRLDLLRALNNVDLSFDSVPEELYVLDVEDLLEELGL